MQKFLEQSFKIINMRQNGEAEMQMRKDFGTRLKNARKMRGLSLAELASRLNGIVTGTAIDKYEKAVMFPQSSTIIIALADALDISIGDLLRPIRYDIKLEGFSFRKKAKLGTKAIESILQKVNLSIEKYFEIQEQTNTYIPYKLGKSINIISNEEQARNAAAELRKELGLGLAPIAFPILLMEDQGIIVIEVNEDPECFDGTSNTINGIPVIVINSRNRDSVNPDEERRRLTLFHEFGHQYLSFAEGLSEKTEEDLCNIFANEMLLPSEIMERTFGVHRDTIYYKELKNLQQEYGISARAIMMKARQMRIINESCYKWFCINLNKDKDAKQYIDRNMTTPQHTNRFEQLVLKALAQNIITISKAAEYLGVTVAELYDDLKKA